MEFKIPSSNWIWMPEWEKKNQNVSYLVYLFWEKKLRAKKTDHE